MQTRPRRQHRRAAIAGLFALLALVACGGDETDPDATAPETDQAVDEDIEGSDPDDAAAESDPDEAAPDEAAADEAEQAEEGWCADFPVADVQAAIGDVVTLTGSSPNPNRAEQCNYAVADTEGGLVAFWEATPGLYEQRLAQAESIDEQFVQRPDLGAEAILLNNADLTILLEDGRELVVALQAFFTDGRDVDQTAAAEGVVSVGELVVERKG